KSLSISGSGAQRDEGDRKSHRQFGSTNQVFPWLRAEARGTRCPCLAPRHGWTARFRIIWPVGGRRSGPTGNRRSRTGIRASSSGRPCILIEHPRVRLDSFTDAGNLFGRENEALSAVGARRGLR